MDGECLFCGVVGAGQLTNEHVNPQWLLQYLGLPKNDQMFQGVASSATGELTQPPRIHSTHSFVQGHVCASCNSGWLSRLESAAKPLVIRLIDQPESLQRLASDEAALLAKWAAKTAYLHSWAGALRHSVELSHVRHLAGDAGTLAPGVAIFAMQSAYVQPTAYIQTGHWPQFAATDVGQDRQTPEAAYKIGLQFRALYLLTAFWPDAASVLVRVRNMHLGLTPPQRQFDPEYAIELEIGPGPVDRLAAFANWLAVWHSGEPSNQALHPTPAGAIMGRRG